MKEKVIVFLISWIETMFSEGKKIHLQSMSKVYYTAYSQGVRILIIS